MTEAIISVEIKTKGRKSVKLNMDEARELYDQLHVIFEVKTVNQPYPVYPWHQRWYNDSQPTYTPPYIWTTTSGGNRQYVGESFSTGMQVTYASQDNGR